MSQPKDPRLKPIEDCTNLGKHQLMEQIEVRQELSRRLVGWLYKNVLAEEILKLQVLLKKCPLV
jgi:hypothetical protein